MRLLKFSSFELLSIIKVDITWNNTRMRECIKTNKQSLAVSPVTRLAAHTLTGCVTEDIAW